MFDETWQIAVDKLRSWVDDLDNPDRPIVGMADSAQNLSPRQMLTHVEGRTELGDKLVKTWHTLALRHMMQTMTHRS
jgi:hypothetical protein